MKLEGHLRKNHELICGRILWQPNNINQILRMLVIYTFIKEALTRYLIMTLSLNTDN